MVEARNNNSSLLGEKDFEQTKILGRGGFGIVAKVKCKDDGKDYAMKMIPLTDESRTSEKQTMDMLREAILMD